MSHQIPWLDLWNTAESESSFPFWLHSLSLSLPFTALQPHSRVLASGTLNVFVPLPGMLFPQMCPLFPSFPSFRTPLNLNPLSKIIPLSAPIPLHHFISSWQLTLSYYVLFKFYTSIFIYFFIVCLLSWIISFKEIFWFYSLLCPLSFEKSLVYWTIVE